MIADTFMETPASLASRFINQTDKHIFLTGKAGTGKTTFLKQIVKNTHKKTLIVAPTGIAAINAGGMTIHSLFQLPFGTFIPINNSGINHTSIKINDPYSLIRNSHMGGMRKQMLKEVELLIIDEVSMLRADILDAMDFLLRHVRRKNHLSFGGVQVLFIGDLMQLPPVVKDEEWSFLKAYYQSIYFFDSLVLQRNKPVYIELDKIYRQGDDRFISLLNNLRNNEVSVEDSVLLKSLYKPGFKPGTHDNYIMLTTHNYKAQNLNSQLLNALQEKSFFYDATIEGEFSEQAYPVENRLELKKGSQVMFVKNDPTGERKFFNGKIGVISNLSNDFIDVQCSDDKFPIRVERYEWQNLKYGLDGVTNEIEETVTGTFTQFPIKLAWAITVHKSQGLTFDKAIIDIGDAFAPGQVYVALSRLRSLEGVVLTSLLNDSALLLDKKVVSFAQRKTEQENPVELVKKESVQFLKNYVLKCFDFDSITLALSEHFAGYNKDENRSSKQRHQDWALKVVQDFVPVRELAMKFLKQLNEIFNSGSMINKEFLEQRVKAAGDYFIPVFKSMSKNILDHIEQVKTEPNTQTYLKELLEVETIVYEQFKWICKASLLSSAYVHDRDVTKEELNKLFNDETRAEKITQVLSMPDKEKKVRKTRVSTGEKKPRVKKEKEDKPDTKTETMRLYKEGKTVEEIAEIRNFAVTTIEGHLAFYVTKKEIQATEFVSQKKLDAIIDVAKSLNTLQLGPIKGALDDSFSYGEIRIAMAHHLSQE